MDTQPELLEAVYPPKVILRDEGLRLEGVDPKNRAGQLISPVIRAHFPEEGGVLMYHQGEKYPTKGWVFKEGLFMADVIKRAVLNALKFVVSLPVNVLRGRVLASAIEQFGDFTECLAERSGTYIKPLYMCTAVREIYRAGMSVAGESQPGRQLVEAICHVLEFDDGYRYRVQDILGEINRESVLRRPSRELVRVLRLAESRGQGTAQKFRHVRLALTAVMLVPAVRRAVRAFFRDVDLERVKLDENDLYKCLIWGGYDFLGATFEERLTIRQLVDSEPEPQPA